MPCSLHSPAFPSWCDLPDIPKDAARRALSALHTLVRAELATVYSPAGSHGTRWNVWLEVTCRRLTLAEWTREWLASQTPETPENGGDVA